MPSLDSPERIDTLRSRMRKPFLRRLYVEAYEKYHDCLRRAPARGIAVEIGSGGGFAKEILPELLTTDIVDYPGVDRVMDATQLDFPDSSLRFLGMLNVFHHLSDAAAFLASASRCLKPGGRLLAIEPYPGWIARPVLRYLHHEPFLPDAREWAFAPGSPLSGANGALPWIVFERDRERFARRFPELRLARFVPHSPLRYWLAGGLKPWSLVPDFAFPFASLLDWGLIRLSPRWGSFVDIELVKTTGNSEPDRAWI